MDVGPSPKRGGVKLTCDGDDDDDDMGDIHVHVIVKGLARLTQMGPNVNFD